MANERVRRTLLRADDVVSIARSWLGTPYHHQASHKHVGTDCLGLVRGVFRELYGYEAETPPAYSKDWAEASRRETLLEGAQRHLVAPSNQTIKAGRVILFRIKPAGIAKHTAIATSVATMIHATEGLCVCEVAITPWWRRRIAGIFTFPGVET